jgi:GAF domain-containing protein
MAISCSASDGSLMKSEESVAGVSQPGERQVPRLRETMQAPRQPDAADVRAIDGRHGTRTVGSVAAIAATCASVLSHAGPMAALRFLNARTRFRFTGLYAADPPLLRNVYLYDRENPTLNLSGTVSQLDETFCDIVWRDNRAFGTPDALKDVRLANHAARERVLSYCGVPIRADSGCPLGSLCHFDIRPRLLPRSEVAVLEAVVSLFAAV